MNWTVFWIALPVISVVILFTNPPFLIKYAIPTACKFWLWLRPKLPNISEKAADRFEWVLMLLALIGAAAVVGMTWDWKP